MRAVELRKGTAINYDNGVFLVHEIQHVAKGNKRSYMQAKLKNVASGSIIDVRFRVDDEVQTAFLDRKKVQYLYSAGSQHVVMDAQSYEQYELPEELLADGLKYIKPNTELEVHFYDGKAVVAVLPNTVDLEVVDTPPVVKGATATNQPKEATLETGLKVRVPPFISPGEVVRIDTRTGQYVERVKSN